MLLEYESWSILCDHSLKIQTTHLIVPQGVRHAQCTGHTSGNHRPHRSIPAPAESMQIPDRFGIRRSRVLPDLPPQMPEGILHERVVAGIAWSGK